MATPAILISRRSKLIKTNKNTKLNPSTYRAEKHYAFHSSRRRCFTPVLNLKLCWWQLSIKITSMCLFFCKKSSSCLAAILHSIGNGRVLSICFQFQMSIQCKFHGLVVYVCAKCDSDSTLALISCTITVTKCARLTHRATFDGLINSSRILSSLL